MKSMASHHDHKSQKTGVSYGAISNFMNCPMQSGMSVKLLFSQWIMPYKIALTQPLSASTRVQSMFGSLHMQFQESFIFAMYLFVFSILLYLDIYFKLDQSLELSHQSSCNIGVNNVETTIVMVQVYWIQKLYFCNVALCISEDHYIWIYTLNWIKHQNSHINVPVLQASITLTRIYPRDKYILDMDILGAGGHVVLWTIGIL